MKVRVSNFITKMKTLKLLALSFLVLVGSAAATSAGHLGPGPRHGTSFKHCPPGKHPRKHKKERKEHHKRLHKWGKNKPVK